MLLGGLRLGEGWGWGGGRQGVEKVASWGIKWHNDHGNRGWVGLGWAWGWGAGGMGIGGGGEGWKQNSSVGRGSRDHGDTMVGSTAVGLGGGGVWKQFGNPRDWTVLLTAFVMSTAAT